MAKVEVQVEQWQERAIQVMVLLSFTMQLMLLVLAEFRRRIDSGVLRAVIWSAYMMADSTAIYTLGHLSVTSRSADHELMAFWAPFLLSHLGGQDNITAYAIEDNRLWLRHLQALAVQVAAAAYVLYESTLVSTQALLRNASILMFVVGVLKYGERVWALKRAGTSASGNSYQSFEKTARRDTEGLLRIAHLLLDVPKNLLQGPLPYVVVYLATVSLAEESVIPTDELYKIVEVQLSLMYDLVYSKAEVIHTWYDLCIRVISPVFTAVAFVLFHRSGLSAGSHYSRADVVITYVLLVGAVTLEMVSVLRAMFSRWSSVTLRKLPYRVEEEWRVWGLLSCAFEWRVWGLLSRAIASIRQFVLPKRAGSRWWWSGSMGQHNLVDLCVGSRASRASRTAGWMGIEDWWNKMVYSSSIPVSTTIKDLVVKQVVSMVKDTDHIIISRGEATLKKWGLYNELKGFLGMDLDESILVWHIATDIYLREHRDQWKATAADDNVLHLAEATEAISNYMVFLLAVRPYMLPDSVSRTKYVEMCYCLTSLKYTTAQDLSSLLKLLPSQRATYSEDWTYNISKYIIMDHTEREREKAILINDTLKAACELANYLVSPKSGPPAAKLEMIAQVWTEILCYAGYRCSGYSHAKQLTSGGELLTIAAILVEYYRRNVLKPLSRKEVKEEEERRAANHGAAGNLKAMTEIALQPTRTEPRSPSSGSRDEISPV